MNIPEVILGRAQELVSEIVRECKKSADNNDIPFINRTSFSQLVSASDVEELVYSRAAVLFIDSLEELQMKDFAPPASDANPEMASYFSAKPKYTPKRTYTIVGRDADIKEKMFQMLAGQESDSGALIEINVQLDGAQNKLVITPWLEQTFIAVTSDLNQIMRTRKDRKSPWIEISF